MTYTKPTARSPGDTLTSAIMNQIRDDFGAVGDARSLTWTPTITATSLNVTYTLQEGRYILIDKLFIGTFTIVLNAVTNAGSGTYTISLPVDPRAPASGLARLGNGEAYDTSATTGYGFRAVRSGSSAMQMRREGASQYVGAAAPFAVATTDEFAGILMFEVA